MQNKRVEGSIRSIGRIKTVGVDEITKARLVKLAGDTPICETMRWLVELGEREVGGGSPGQIPLPWQASSTSRNTITSISTRIDALAKYIFTGELDKAVFNFIGMGEAQGYHSREVTYTPGMLRRDVVALAHKVNELTERFSGADGTQGELELDG